jgi:hypothetical protein
MSSIDSADEAGGEAIYSSDGLPSLSAPRAPKLTSNVSTSGEDVLDSNELMDPAAAMSIYSPASKESAKAKLARLQREVAELEAEMKGDDVSKLATALSSRLVSGMNAQDDLTKLIEDYKAKEKSDIKERETGGLVYELYGGTVVSLSSAEERILQLEQMLGRSVSNSPCIMSRLQSLEQKMRRVDSKSIDDAATRAKAIRYVATSSNLTSQPCTVCSSS